jgi:hypothetical protein
MPPLTIEIQGLAPDLLDPSDNPVLADAIQEAINPTRPMPDGAGFQNSTKPPPHLLFGDYV